MSYYTNSYSSSSSFYNLIKMKQGKDQPLDSVCTIVNDPYRNNEHNFVAVGWDGVFRYYRIIPKNTEEIEMVYSRNLEHPIFSAAFGDGSLAFAGLATGEIVAVDMANNQTVVIGNHNAPICKLFWVHNFNLLLSLGYDNKLKFWDTSNQSNFLARQFDLPQKTHTAAYDFPYLMVGSGNGKLGFINLNNLPNIKIPDSNSMYDIIEIGSKFTCSRICSNSKIYALGCSDGRCIISYFEDGYHGPRPVNDSNKKMNSKAMKKQGSYNHTPLYGQINDIQVGIQNNQQYLILTGSDQIAFFNTRKRDKPKRIKTKGTAGTLSLDGKYFVFAEGNDWSEGINDLKKSTRPKIEAVRFSKSEIDSFVEEKK